MFALVAAIILFLHGFGVLDNSTDVNWWVVGIAFIALHLSLPFVTGVYANNAQRRRSS